MLDSSSPIDQAFVNVSIRYALFIGITLILLPFIPALSNRFRALLWAFSLFSFMLFCSLSILGTSLVWKVLPQKPSELSIPIKADPIPEQTRLKNPVATTPLPIQTTPLPPEENSYNGFVMLFLLGSLSIGSYWLLGQFRLKKLLSTALLLEKDHPLVKRLQLHSGGKAILLYLSPSTQIPFACGMIRPRIVLPTNVDQWSQDRLDMVLRHEYAHIANWDLLLANLARITLVAQWFNPLVWLIYKSFLKNAEKACDDQVLDSGTEPTEYARCLVDFAKAHPLPKLLHAIQFSITKTKKNMITTRIQNILKRKCDRKPIGFLKLTPALIIMACFGLPISIVELRADTPTENSISSKKDSEQGNPQTGQEVRIHMKILEVDSKNLEELSKPLLGTGSKTELVQPVLMVKNMQGKLPESSQLAALSRISILSKEKSDEFVRTMEQLKGTDLLTAPSITVLNGKTAEVSIGQEYFYPSSSDKSEENKLHFDGTFAERTIGVTAELTPRASEKGTLSLDFMVEVTEFEGMLSHEELKNKGMTITDTDNYEKTFPEISERIAPIFRTQRVESKLEIYEGSVIHFVNPRSEAIKTFHKTVASTLDPLPKGPKNTAIIDKHLIVVIGLKKI